MVFGSLLFHPPFFIFLSPDQTWKDALEFRRRRRRVKYRQANVSEHCFAAINILENQPEKQVILWKSVSGRMSRLQDILPL
jgi:hypothetical protein